MNRILEGFLIVYILASALFASAYVAAQYIPQKREEKTYRGTVYIYGDKPLARAFAVAFSAAGYKVIMIPEEKPQKTKFRTRQAQPPNVEIVNPPNESYVSGNISLTILAYDDYNVSKVILYIDGVQKEVWEGAGTFIYYWDTTQYTNGQHNVTAWANDTDGNENLSLIHI